MKPYYKLICILSILIFPFSVSAQPQDVLEVETLTEMTKNIDDTATNLIDISSPLVLARKSISGIYLNSDWSPAVVYTKNKEFLNCLAKFNIYKNRMEIKLGDEFRAINKNKISGVILEGAPFIAIASGEEEDSSVMGFYEVLADGPICLLRKYKLSLHNKGGTALHPTLGTEQEYKSSHELYYCKEGEKAFKLKKGKKNILKVLSSNEEALKAYADEAGLGFRKDKDLAAMFNWYNGLKK